MTAKTMLRAIVFPCLLIFSFLTASAQDKTVTGRVVDSKDNTPVAGASVTAKGTNVGTSTGADGTFTLSVPSTATTLVISSVGFVTQEIAITTGTMGISLVQGGSNLNEVVVTGYGTQRRREVTSAITKISPEGFNKGNIADVAQLLQGKVAGLSISKAGSNPNGGYTLRLRGLSTIGPNSQPLVVVDGQVGADLNTIDPNDIANIEVLKDGSAAAIYGTRGSAGVIIVTSKKGRAGTSQLNYSGSVSIEDPFRFTPHMTAAEFRALGKGTDYGASTDWNDEITRTAVATTHNIGFTGGNSQTTYSVSFNYRNQEGVAIETGFQQFNGRANITHKALKNRLVLTLDMNGTKRENKNGYADAFKYATIYNPTAPVYTNDPLFNITGGGYYEANFVDYSNPVAMLKQNTNKTRNLRYFLQGSAELEIIKGLKWLARYGQQDNNNINEQYSPRTAFISRGFANGVTGYARRGYSYRNFNESFNRLFESTLSYNKRFGKLGLDAVAGYSWQQFDYQGHNVGAGDFITDASSYNFGAAVDTRNGLASIGSYKNANRLIAFFGRVNLNWDDFIFLSASLRHEGSTMFGKENQWGDFPAVSAGIDLKRIIDLDFINSLKFRASYGQTGALPPSPYLSMDRLQQTGSYYAGNNNYLFPYAGFVNPNPNLGWERKTELDFGLDFSLFSNRLNGSFDYYNRQTKDLIFNVGVPSPPNLFNNTWQNIGILDNHGIELSLNYDVFRRQDFTWTTGLVYTTYNVFLKELNESLKGAYVGSTNLGTPGQEATELNRNYEGEPIGNLWGYKFIEVDPRGKYLFADANGKPVRADSGAVRQFIGNGLPDFEFGWTNSFKYKNWDLSFFFRGAIGHEMINTFRAFYENPNVATSYNVINSKYFNPAITDAQIYSSLHVEKGSFAKLDNATIGYNLPIRQGSNFSSYVRNLRLYVTGQNLFMITEYTGVDPEVRYQDGSNVLAPGIDRRETWVMSRIFTFGLNIGL
ncbi:SusC/RagA family TonB-linked outer membrane protein [Pollutibacter soli]|uniref:SusC/RagA family TonB-linked outer membrane protein n=1 Tax=Pollutibacter soli TaxID=3034157 RepID=UPI0030138F7E